MNLYNENETVLYQARVGRRIGVLYVLAAALCFLLGAGSLLFAILALAKGENAVSAFASAAVLAAVGAAVLVMRRTMLRREYILTDRRLILRKGGSLVKSTRFLCLDDVMGVDLSNNFLIDLFGVCSVDFFSPAISSASKKFLIFSISTTPFKFQYVNKQDGEAIFQIVSALRADRSGSVPASATASETESGDRK